MAKKPGKICFVCEGFGSRASDQAYAMMQTAPCAHCNGTGRIGVNPAPTKNGVPK